MRNTLRVVAGIGVVVVAVVAWWLVRGQHRSASDSHACRSPVEDEWVRGGPECLHFQLYRSAALSTRPDLVVVLHGDAPFTNPSYQYALARRISSETDNVIAVGLLRPGYTDAEGYRSSGTRGRAVGDNYTPEIIDAITQAIQAMIDAYLPGRVFVVGHSGGSAIAADLIGRHPGLANGAVLVSCPCDVPSWRLHMDSVQHLPIWRTAIRSLSPLDLASHVDPRTTVRVVVGTMDSVTPDRLSHAYAERLKAHGVPVESIDIPGVGHEIFLDGRVAKVIEELLASGGGIMGRGP
jgi:predicted esterase